jgi:hypothetical protein
MSTPGLSLVGYLDRPRAIEHLRTTCVFASDSDEALADEWARAKAKLGGAFPKAGVPAVLPPTSESQAHFQLALTEKAFQRGGAFHGAFPVFVEIAPILAAQCTIDLDRIAHHVGATPLPPLERMLEICLPSKPRAEPFHTLATPQSLSLKTKSMNVKLGVGGVFHNSILGVAFGVSSPHVRVVRYNGRFHMQNGFHRAVGLGLAGATHLPCLLKDIDNPMDIGITAGATFSLRELESDNPPTLGHFTHGRAHEVQLRSLSRVLHVSWSEYTVPDE